MTEVLPDRTSGGGLTRVVFLRETRELWVGGKALYLMLAYSVLLTIVTFVFASSSELSLIPPKEMVFEAMRISLASAAFICLIIGADMISGERERATLEFLLLTPASKRQLAIGKLAAAVTPWPAAYLVALPYWYILSQGDEAFFVATRWSLVFGSLLVPALAALGMLISMRSTSNRTSMFVSLGIYLLVLVPTQLPGSAQTGPVGRFVKRISPMESTYHFMEKTIVNSRTSDEVISFIASPIALFLLMVGSVVIYARRGMRLEPLRRAPRGVATGVAMLLLAFLVLPAGVAGAQAEGAQSEGLTITVDTEVAQRGTGDPLLFTSVLQNAGSDTIEEVIVAMNIINVNSEGDVVDPEDWSPERTQYVPAMGPGAEVSLSWRVNPILAGDYLVYLVAIPAPEDVDSTSNPVTSSGIHLVVSTNVGINPGGVLPIIIAVPVVLGLGIFLMVRRQRRSQAA